MAIVSKYPKRVLFPYDLPGSLPGEKVLCLREDEVSIILAYISQFPFWVTSWVKEDLGDYYEVPNDAEMNDIENFMGDLVYKLQEGDFMLCENLEGLISALTLAVEKSSSCCCGSGGSGSGGSGQSDSGNDTQQTINDGVANPPAGFDDWPSFDTHRCNVAQLIIDQLKQDLSSMGTLNLIGVTIAGLAPLLAGLVLTPIPGDELLAIASVIIAASTIGNLVIADAASVLANNEASLLCELYTGQSMVDSRAGFIDAFYSQAQSELSTAVQAFAATQLITLMLTNDSINRMVDADLPYMPATADCSGCVGCSGAIINTSDSIENGANLVYSLTGNYVTVDSIQRGIAGGNYWIVEFLFNNETGLYQAQYHCGNQVVPTGYTITSGSLTSGGISGLQLLGDTRNSLWSDSGWAMPSPLIPARGFTILSTTQFSVKVDVQTFDT